MRFVSLLGGGKDSYYALLSSLRLGHELICLAALYSPHPRDSRLFHSSSLQAIQGISQALSKPLVSSPLLGEPLCTDLVYTKTAGDEVEDLYELLTIVKYRYPDVEAVVSGVVASSYQRLRIEEVCARLGLVSIAPLWKSDQMTLLREEIDAGIEAVVVKASAMGLTQDHIGKTVRELMDHFADLSVKFGFNMCGEGGEYQTLVVNAPDFAYKLIPVDTDIQALSSSTSRMTISNIELENKETGEKSAILPVPPLYPAVFKTITHITTGELTAASFGHTTCTSTEDEAFVILQGIRNLLSANSIPLDHIYYVHVTLKDLRDFLRFNQVYKWLFNRPGPPARCCVETSSQQCRVKIAFKATADKKNILHVQSISSWAPANVGPYSQAIEVQEKLHMAGAIALDPASMMLAQDEVAQCFVNLKAVAEVMGYEVINAEQTVVYYVGEKPEIPPQYKPFYMKVTRIPKDGNVEIEMHLKKNYPAMKTEEIALEGEGFNAKLLKRFNTDLLYAQYQVDIETCAQPAGLLVAIRRHLDDYFLSILRKSPTLECELLSRAPLSNTILSYITEVRILSPDPEAYRTDWLCSVPSYYIASETSGLLISIEDRLQHATQDFIQTGT